MNDCAEVRETGVRSRRRWLYGLILIASVTAATPVAGWLFFKNTALSTLHRAIADADRLDPGWRLDELEQRREALPDEQNAAIQVQAAIAELPRRWPDHESAKEQQADGIKRGSKLVESLDIAPEVQLDADQIAGLGAELGEVATAVARARILAEMPKGRYPITYDPVWFMTRLDHLQRMYTVARLLQLDVMLHAQQGEVDSALDSCRAQLNVGRSLGDEPTASSQLVRMAITSRALSSLERVLAQGEASEAALIRIQELLSDEVDQPLDLFSLRGDRAGMFSTYEKLGTGEINPDEIGKSPTSGPSWANHGGLCGRWFYQYNQGLSLGFFNPAVEIAKRQRPEQAELWWRFSADTREPDEFFPRFAGSMAYGTNSTLGVVSSAHLRIRAVFGSAILMVALERYRRAHGCWPDVSELLVPSMLRTLPADPYTALPITVTHRNGGLSVYSLGPDRRDNGGNYHKILSPVAGTDQGYRLWDLSRRRQTPPAP